MSAIGMLRASAQRTTGRFHLHQRHRGIADVACDTCEFLCKQIGGANLLANTMAECSSPLLTPRT